MSSKNTAEVILGGKVIKLGGYESEEYLQNLHHTLTIRLQSLIRMRDTDACRLR